MELDAVHGEETLQSERLQGRTIAEPAVKSSMVLKCVRRCIAAARTRSTSSKSEPAQHGIPAEADILEDRIRKVGQRPRADVINEPAMHTGGIRHTRNERRIDEKIARLLSLERLNQGTITGGLRGTELGDRRCRTDSSRR